LNVINKKQLDSANQAVTGELAAFGFWDEELAKTDTYLTLAGRAYGWQMYESSGEIHIPAISLNRLSEKILKQKRVTLRDILRHEFAHTYPELVKNKQFEKVFGGPHELDSGLAQVYDPAFHVSEYAASMPMEDFAEDFMHYLKHKGELPKRLDQPAIRKKWNYIDKLPAKIKRKPAPRPSASKRAMPVKRKASSPAPTKAIKLKVKTTEQKDGHNCGAHAVLALLKYHGWNVSFREIKEELGSEPHALPPIPGRAKVERLLDKYDLDSKGTLPFDLFHVLWNHRFTTRLLPLSATKLKPALHQELAENRPIVAGLWNGSYPHGLVISGMDKQGAWVADSLDAKNSYRMDWEKLDTDLFAAIVAIPKDDLLVSALTRSATCTATLIQRVARRRILVGKG